MDVNRKVFHIVDWINNCLFPYVKTIREEKDESVIRNVSNPVSTGI